MAFRIISLILSVVFISTTSLHAQGTPQQRQQLEQEYIRLFMGARALSSCPALIEQWEYEILKRRADDIEEQLAGQAGIPGGTKHQLNLQADAYKCDNPQLKEEASNLRVYAAQQWLLQYKTYLNAEDCRGQLLYKEQEEFLEKFEPFVVAVLASKLGDDAVEGISSAAAPLVGGFNNACRYAFNDLKDKLAGIDLQLKLSWIISAPWGQRNGLMDSEKRRELIFNTAPAGELKRAEKAAISFSSIRGFRSITPHYASVRGLCAGRLVTNYLLECAFLLKQDGSIALQLNDLVNGEVDDIHGVRLEILDGSTGNVTHTYDGEIPDNHYKDIVFKNMKEILEGADPAHIVKFTFDLTIDGKKTGYKELTVSASGEATKGAVIADLLKAYAFAFASPEDDLSQNGGGLVNKVLARP